MAVTSAQSSATYRARKIAEDPEGFRARHRATHARWRKKHLEREQARNRAISCEKRMFYDAKSRAKKNRVPFNIELADVVIPATCPVLGIPLRKGEGQHGPSSPTLDRMVPSKGYVKGNVLVISFRANTLKNDATTEEVERLLSWMKANVRP